MASNNDDTADDRPEANSTTPASKAARSPRGGKPRESHVGLALRSAYDEAVREDVPDEFLDLLGKLS